MACLHREITPITGRPKTKCLWVCEARCNKFNRWNTTAKDQGSFHPFHLSFVPHISPLSPHYRPRFGKIANNKPWPNSSEACWEERHWYVKAAFSDSVALFWFQVNSGRWEMLKELFASDRLKRLQRPLCAAAFIFFVCARRTVEDMTLMRVADNSLKCLIQCIILNYTLNKLFLFLFLESETIFNGTGPAMTQCRPKSIYFSADWHVTTECQ